MFSNAAVHSTEVKQAWLRFILAERDEGLLCSADLLAPGSL